jgi:hypothetical protein
MPDGLLALLAKLLDHAATQKTSGAVFDVFVFLVGATVLMMLRDGPCEYRLSPIAIGGYICDFVMFVVAVRFVCSMVAKIRGRSGA